MLIESVLVSGRSHTSFHPRCPGHKDTMKSSKLVRCVVQAHKPLVEGRPESCCMENLDCHDILGAVESS